MTMPYNPVTCLHFHYTDHNGDLAVAQPIVLAWFGKDIPPSTHPLATVANAIVYPAVLEESEHTVEGLPWILFLARALGMTKSTVVDVYSREGM